MTDSNGDQRYPRTFEPITIGPVEIPNRLYMPPHGIPLIAAMPGREAYAVPAAEHAYYFAERARGGAGLICHSLHMGPFARQPVQGNAASPWLEESIPSFGRVADLVHEEGSKIFGEIWYANFMPHTWDQLSPEAPILGSSHNQHYFSPAVSRAIGKREIRHIIDAHARCTRNLEKAGYDGIEMHPSHGALLEVFLSPTFNRRTDEYGGSTENRARLLVQCLEASREACGSDFAIGMRINADELLPTGLDAEGTREVLEHVVGAGLLDFVDLDVSVEPEQQYLMTTSFMEEKLHNAKRVAAVSDAARPLPVLATPGRLTSIGEAEELLESGSMDMVGAARGLIAEPMLARHAREGRETDSRECIAANHCVDGAGTGGFGCAINPEAAREGHWGDRARGHAPEQKRVVVVGAGPAGLEAARIAAQRGHEVTLFERREEIGGGLRLWSMLPGRDHVGKFPKWHERQIGASGIDLRLGVDADEESVLGLEPDVVVLATGSRYATDGRTGMTRMPIPGADQDWVHAPEAVIEGDVQISGKVVVLDEEGLHAAVGCAEIAAAGGGDVEVISRKPMIAAHAIWDLKYIMERLRAAGVRMTTNELITSIGDHAVSTVNSLGSGEQREITGVDHVILATMREPVTGLSELEGKVPYVYVVGDAPAPRKLREATWEGYRFARAIGEPDMPESVQDELFEPSMTPLEPAANV